MSIADVTAGNTPPEDCNVIIEIPTNGPPIKYEVDKASGAMFVDRFMSTAMHYPCNYGYIPQTLWDDGDPIDVLVLSPVPLMTGVVIRCRPVGVLRMEDENGNDAKILAAPLDRVCRQYQSVRDIDQVSQVELDRIAHFFSHYKDLEPGKFVRVSGWGDAAEARREITKAIHSFAAKPH